MEDSLEKTNRLIKLAQQRLVDGDRSDSDETVEISLSLEDLEETAAQLRKKVEAGLRKLMGKDSATATALKKAIQNEFLALRLKSRALLMRIRQRVLQSLLAAVPFKRRISRAKKGGAHFFDVPRQVSLCRYNPDVQIKKHTEDSIARRVPGIKQLAARYNSICNRLQNHCHRKYYPALALPAPLDIDQLFNTNANPEMWLETGLDPEDLTEPPQYLYDEAVKSGISAMLMKDRAEEEKHRLQSELRIMISWLTSNLEAAKAAAGASQGAFLWLIFLLQISNHILFRQTFH